MLQITLRGHLPLSSECFKPNPMKALYTMGLIAIPGVVDVSVSIWQVVKDSDFFSLHFPTIMFLSLNLNEQTDN